MLRTHNIHTYILYNLMNKITFLKIYKRFQRSLLFQDSLGADNIFNVQNATVGLLHLFLQNVIGQQRGTPFPTLIVKVWQLSENVETMRRPEPSRCYRVHIRDAELAPAAVTAVDIVVVDSGGDSTAAAVVAAAAAAAVVRPFRVGDDAGWVERARGVGQVEENSSPAAGDVSAHAEVSQQRESRY